MPNIYQALLIGATAEKVYDAITTQEGLSGWWTPEVEAKKEVNSTASFTFMNGYVKKMKVTELVPAELVKWHCMEATPEWVGTNLSFQLEYGDKKTLSVSHPELSDQLNQLSSEKATLLIFHHDDWKEYTLMFAECSYTWGRFLWSLKLLCERGKGLLWSNQHRVDQ